MVASLALPQLLWQSGSNLLNICQKLHSQLVIYLIQKSYYFYL